MINKY
jgi:hypothetical protein